MLVQQGRSVVCPAATTVGYEPRASGVRQFTGMRRLSSSNQFSTRITFGAV